MQKTTTSTARMGQFLVELAKSEATGAMTVEMSHFRKTIYLIAGTIIGVESSDPADALPRRLYMTGTLDQPQLDAAVELQELRRKPLVDVLVATGMLSAGELDTVLEKHALEVIWSLFIARDTRITFAEDELPDELAAAVSVDVADVVEEGLRRSVWAARMREQLDGQRIARCAGASSQDVELVESWVLELLSIPRSADDLEVDGCLMEWEALCALDVMLKRGSVRPLGTDAGNRSVETAAAETFVDPDFMVATARKLMDAARFEEALDLFRQAEQVAPSDAYIASLRASAESVYCSQVAGDELPLESRPRVTMVPTSVRASMRPFMYRLLGLTDGTRTVRELLGLVEGSLVDTFRALLDLKRCGAIELHRSRGVPPLIERSA